MSLVVSSALLQMIRFSDSRRLKPNKLGASARTDREKKDLCLVLTPGACSQFVFKLEASARIEKEEKCGHM